MYAETKFNWIDNSAIEQSVEVPEIENRTLFFTLLTADKGPEVLTRLHGNDFYKMFGKTLSYKKHGQALLQAKKIIDAGGELLVKRFVADDATLSNIIIVANVTDGAKTQKLDDDGNKLYVSASDGSETTNATEITGEGLVENKPIMVDVEGNDPGATIKFELVSIEGAKTYEEVMEAAEAEFDDEAGRYPILVATDIGRNADIKRLAIRPDYAVGKTLSFMPYTMVDFENTSVEDMATISMNPSVIFKGKAYSVNQFSMKQIKLGAIPTVFDKYVEKIAVLSGLDKEVLMNMDLIFGKDRKGTAINGINIDKEGADLGYEFGIALQNGSDGNLNAGNLEAKMVAFMSGMETDEIYDKDVHKIAVIADANYPVAVKEAIVKFVDFREDCIFLRDYGTECTTFEQIKTYQTKLTHSRFAVDYMTWYQVYDPFTNQRIAVTLIYNMIEPLMIHFQGGAARPMAGIANGFIVSEAIPGTINYIPRNIPGVNQKDQLDDARINYATYYEYGGNLVVDSLYTSQEAYTQLSYANNVIAIQEVMRAIRSECPVERFKFTKENDFSEYQLAVQNILDRYDSAFNSIRLIYQQDDIKASQKIFYAAIEFAFNNWAQSEVFDLYAINATFNEE